MGEIALEYVIAHPIFSAWLAAQIVVGSCYFRPTYRGDSHGDILSLTVMVALLFPGSMLVGALSPSLIGYLEAHDIEVGNRFAPDAPFEIGEWMVAAVVTYLFWTCGVLPLYRWWVTREEA